MNPGSYNKSRLIIGDYRRGIENAVARARALDTRPADRWPRSLGSRVYQLVERILGKDG